MSPAAKSSKKSPQNLERFRKLLDSFVFFHLGGDAHVALQEAGDRFEISVDHARVRPFRWCLSAAELARLSADRDAFEEAILDQLTVHRKS